MADFPRTKIENLSVSRMIIGTNWFLGWSHTSAAKDRFIQKEVTVSKSADILEAFMRAGVDTIMGFAHNEKMMAAVKEAEQRVGRKVIIISTPHFDLAGTSEADAKNAKMLDEEAAMGVSVCLPHACTTDVLVDKLARRICRMDTFCKMIRERGMIPGLSTHMPEAPVYADESGLDVATYIQIYNAVGFLMQIEVDWVARMIWQRKHPVITIKPMASGRLQPFVGLSFVWATLRDQDMVTVGAMTAEEAKETIEISLAQLERRSSSVPLQRTRSKKTIDGK